MNNPRDGIKVTAVVVTYNRKKLLLECLEALKKQTYSVSRIVLVDNASTDGTHEAVESAGFIDDNFDYVKMESNTGGSGGFFHGIRKSMENPSDWLWIMDDDTIPASESLEELLNGIQTIKKQGSSRIAYVASTVYGENGEYMNVPTISERLSTNGYMGWYQFLTDGIVEISVATFVSILVCVDAIKRCGLPCRDFFIWGDDTEFTRRLTSYYGPGYLVGNSKVIHKRVGAKALNINNETDPKRIKMYHYLYRNCAITAKYYRQKGFTRIIVAHAIYCLKLLGEKHSLTKIKSVIKGIFEACIEYRHFKKFLDEQIKTGY